MSSNKCDYNENDTDKHYFHYEEDALKRDFFFKTYDAQNRYLIPSSFFSSTTQSILTLKLITICTSQMTNDLISFSRGAWKLSQTGFSAFFQTSDGLERSFKGMKRELLNLRWRYCKITRPQKTRKIMIGNPVLGRIGVKWFLKIHQIRRKLFYKAYRPSLQMIGSRILFPFPP